MRQALCKAMETKLGYRLPLKLIQEKRVAEYLSYHLSTLELNVIIGHAPREVVEMHYLLKDQVEELHAKHDQATSKVTCLRGGGQ